MFEVKSFVSQELIISVYNLVLDKGIKHACKDFISSIVLWFLIALSLLH